MITQSRIVRRLRTGPTCAWFVGLAVFSVGLLAIRGLSGQDVFLPSVVHFTITDDEPPTNGANNPVDEDENGVRQASLLTFQPAIPLLVPLRPGPEAPPAATGSPRNLLGGSFRERMPAASPLTISSLTGPSIISGDEARGRITSDAGSLLLKSPAAISTGIQRRNPIINDPRVRGSRVGSLAGSGSYWIPARIDLDTLLSKIDSRIVQQITVVPGPYSVLNGPGLQSIQFDLLATPRYADGPELHGSTSADYMNNGQQFYGRQDIWGGSDAGGFRFGYGHRTGNDYQSGAGVDIPSSFNSRDINFSVGRDLSPDSHIEFTYLRLDQTNVELPGQAFDINSLATDAYEVDYLLENQQNFDQLAASAWYNRTKLNGDAQRVSKRREFPLLDAIKFMGRTDVDATSTGYQLAPSWIADAGEQLTLGTDLRFVNQELNEITSAGRFFLPITPWTTTNSPIPDSNWINPGLFAQYVSPEINGWQTTFGARMDVVSTAIVDDPAKLADVGTIHTDYANIVGTNIQDRTFGPWAAYASTRYERDDGWSFTLAAGHAERAPNLTELYVAQSFMFLLQNGLNTVTGDPRLAPEQSWQIDGILSYQGERFKAQVRGFQSWIHDYITFENIGVVRTPPNFAAEQINLKYVNTDLATLTGTELLGTYAWTDMLTPFANLQYVRGQDQTRNGHFATIAAYLDDMDNGVASQRKYGKPRGFYSDIGGAAREPLPQIIPLQSRIGLRLHEASANPRWNVEIAARIVGPQNRVAVSLLELPSPGFAVGDIHAYWQSNSSWTILAGIENFTDRNYREHLDFRHQPGAFGLNMFQPGINAYTGIQRTY